ERMKLSDVLAERAKLVEKAKVLRGQEGKEDEFNKVMEDVDKLTCQAEEAKRQERFDALLNMDMSELTPRASDPLPTEDEKNTRQGKHEFSIVRAVNLIASGRALNGIESETVKEMQK